MPVDQKALGKPLVSLDHVVKRFGEVEVLKDISFDVARGETICIIGPSGSGKSTILRCINALIPVTSGSIKVDGVEVNDPKLDELAGEGMTCILVTHEMGFAREVADHVYFTDAGLIVEHGSPAELLARPQEERTRAFLEQVL